MLQCCVILVVVAVLKLYALLKLCLSGNPASKETRLYVPSSTSPLNSRCSSTAVSQKEEKLPPLGSFFSVPQTTGECGPNALLNLSIPQPIVLQQMHC